VPGEEPELKTGLYDRKFLLGEKRNKLIDLWEVERYGLDSFGDPDFVSIYGLKPAEWYARGVRLLGRTAAECTRDRFAELIASDLSAVAKRVTTKGRTTVIDPFAGSGNTLYWITRQLEPERSVGLFVKPPWGDALDPDAGLDFRRTTPPVGEIIDLAAAVFHSHKLLFGIQAYESVKADSLAEVTERLESSVLKVYDINPHAQNPGLLLGTVGWIPASSLSDALG
jgi:hypothetical protein